MDTKTALKDWLVNMGYDGEIPDHLEHICNPSTVFIWEQIISKVKPRETVEHVRKNVIINRLREKSISEQDTSKFPIKEIETYIKKQNLEKRKKALESTIREKRNIAENLLQQNKILYARINNVKSNIQENEEKTFLIETRSKAVEQNIADVEEVITLARNLTPLEMDESSDSNKISETLEKCAEKLENLIEKSNITGANSTSSLCFPGTGKSFKYPSSSRYYPEEENACSVLKIKDRDKRDSLGLLPDSCLDIPDENFLISNTSHSTESSSDISTKLCSDETINTTLRELLYNNNRYQIFKNCLTINNDLIEHLHELCLECNKAASASKVDKEDLTELYLIHLKTELEKEKYAAILRKLEESTKARIEEVYNNVAPQSFLKSRPDSRKIFEMQIEEVKLDAAIDFMNREISGVPKMETEHDLPMTVYQIKQTREQAVLQTDLIQHFIEIVHRMLERIKNSREEVVSIVRRLNNFTMDMSWADQLNGSFASDERETFKEFPLRFNRNLSKKSAKNWHFDVIPTDVSADDFKMLVNLIDVPFSPPEGVFMNFLKSPVTLRQLKNPQQQLCNPEYPKYCLRDLLKREEANKIDELVEQLEKDKNSSVVKKIISLPSRMRDVKEFWIEMPVRDYISERRLVEDKPYKYYEKKYDSFGN